jgi:2-aminoadipate transaminase
MRLNFSGVSERDIHEGIRRIGEVVHEQVGLYGTLTGTIAPRRDAETASRAPERPDPGLAKVLELRKRAG